MERADMAGFNLQGVLQQAQKSVEKQAESGSKGVRYPLLYPQQGALKIKLFFNPKSNTVIRSISRHKINGKQVPCLRTYGQDCPICEAVQNINNATGQNFWGTYGAKTRGIAFAQYIQSTYPVTNNNNAVPQGSTVLFMFPKTVEDQLNAAFVNAADNMQLIVAANEGYFFNVERDQKNSYTSSVDAFNKYTSFQNSEQGSGDDMYNKFLEELPDIREQIMPAALTDEMRQNALTIAQEITAKHINTNVNNPGAYTGQQQPNFNPGFNPQPQGGVQNFGGQIPAQPQQNFGQPQQQNPFSTPQTTQAPAQPQQATQSNPFSGSAPQPAPVQQPQAQPAPQQESQQQPTQAAPQQAPQGNPFGQAPAQQAPQQNANPFGQPQQNGATQKNPFSQN